jgi:hypothetical protein
LETSEQNFYLKIKLLVRSKSIANIACKVTQTNFGV